VNSLKLLIDLYLLKHNAQKPEEQVKKLQDKKLRKLLKYTCEHSEYYHRAFAQAGITKKRIGNTPLSAFPSIDKATFLESFDELVTVPSLKQEELRQFDQQETTKQKNFMGRFHVVHSSGSTEKPSYFVYDESAWEQMLIAVVRAAFWDMTVPQIFKLLTKGLRVAYIAATDGRYGGAMAVGDGIRGVHARQLFLDINMPLAQWVEQIRTFRPNFIIGYPSAIKILGGLVEKGEVQITPLRVVTCGEPLDTGLRCYFESVFFAKVINFYGASESLALGVEVDPDDGIILFDDMNVIEVENGRMYLTSLYNYAQPLIRYRLSDQLKFKKRTEKSSCSFTRALNLLGRDEDILWFQNCGKREFLHPLAIEGFCLDGMVDYQFLQVGDDAFEMLAEVPREEHRQYVRAEMEKLMGNILLEKCLDYVKFSVHFVDSITPDPQTGKKRLVVKNTEKARETK